MLALDALRREIAERSKRKLASQVDWVGAAIAHPLSRRALFKVGAAGGALAQPKASAASLKSLEIRTGEGVFSLTAGDRTWTVATDQFEGRPSLQWTRSEQKFSVQLTSALLPGSNLPFDFSLVAERSRGNWHGRFLFPSWEGEAEASLDEWLAGDSSALTPVRIPRSRAGYEAFDVRIGGAAILSFGSDGLCKLVGPQLALVRTPTAAIACSVAAFQWARPNESLLYEAAANRRTRLTLGGPDLSGLRPTVAQHAVQCGAAELSVELVREPMGKVLVASLWSADSASAGITIPVPGADAIRVDMDSYRLLELQGEGIASSKTLIAGLKPGERWHDAGTASVEVASGPSARLEVSENGAGAATACCDTGTSRFVVPFLGADSACFRSRSDVCSDPRPVEFKDKFSLFHEEEIRIDGFDFAVSRTVDGFNAIFRFANISLRSRRGRWFLIPSAATSPSPAQHLMEFELGSQHLSEEALFSASPPGESKASNETFCGPFGDSRARFVTFVGMRACKAWNTPQDAVDREVQALLFKFAELLLARAARTLQERKLLDPAATSSDHALLKILNDNKRVDLPAAFAKFLTQEYALVLEQAASTTKPTLIQPRADQLLVDVKLGNWQPSAIESQPSRLLFTVAFPPSGEVPFDLQHLMSWSDPESRDTGLSFTPKLSERALASDVDIGTQKRLSAKNGAPVTGLANGSALLAATGLQMPYRLTVSPLPQPPSRDSSRRSYWSASPAPARVWGTSVALWHVRATGPGGGPVPMRALASPDFLPNSFFKPPRPYLGAPGVRTSLDAHDRHNLVALTSGYGQDALLGSASVVATALQSSTGSAPEMGQFVPQPFHAQRLILSPLGASFDFLGTWDPPGTQDGALTVSKWDHRARLRRDTEVTVEYRGFLMPLGIPAVFIKKTTREFKRAGEGSGESYRAVLVQRYSIRVDDRVHEYPGVFHPYEARDWCFRRVKVLPLETPPLLPPESVPDSRICNYGRQAFWPMVPASSQAKDCASGRLFEFTVEAGDTSFRTPLVFVDNEVAHTPSSLREVLLHYLAEVEQRKWELISNPQRDPTPAKALARVVSGEVEFLPGLSSRNSRHAARAFVMGVRVPGPPVFMAGAQSISHLEDPTPADLASADLAFNAEREKRKQPPFYPRVSQALVESQLLARLSGNAVQRNNFTYHPVFTARQFDAQVNAGGVFVRIVDRDGAPMNFSDNTAASGGALSPSTHIVALAREHGPVGGKQTSDPVQTVIQTSCLLPALVAPGARAMAAGQRAAPLTLKQIQPTADDPVAKFMQGISDPVEYFAQMLTKAKLLGCVKLSDIIKTVLTVSGTQVPRINQQEIFDGVVDALRPALLAGASGVVPKLGLLRDYLKGSKTPSAVRARLLPSLVAAIESLERAQRELRGSSADPASIASHAANAYGHLRKFAEDLKQLSENPVALLPPAIGDVVAKARSIYTQLETAWTALQSLPQVLRENVVKAAEAELRALADASERAVRDSAEFRAVSGWVEAVQAEAQAMEASLRKAALQEAGRALLAFSDAVAHLRAWVALVEKKAGNLRERLEAGVQALIPYGEVRKNALDQIDAGLTLLRTYVDALQTVYDSVASQPSAAVAVQETQRVVVQLREELFTLKSFLEGLPAQLPDARAIPSALEFTAKLDSILGKTRELMTSVDAQREVFARTRVVALPFDVSALHEIQSKLVAAASLRAKLEALRESVRTAQAGAAAGLQTAVLKALTEAIDIARNLEAGGAQLEAEIRKRKQSFLGEVQAQLGILASAISERAAPLVKLVNEWSVRVASAENALASGVVVGCKLVELGPLPNFNKEGSPLSRELIERMKRFNDAVKSVGESCTVVAANRTLSASAAAVREATALAEEVGSLLTFVGEAVQGGNLGALLDEQKLIDEALQAIGVPSKLRVSYDWDTDVEEYPRGGGAIFRPVRKQGRGPGGAPRLSIHATTLVDLRKGGTPQTLVEGVVDPFDLHLFGTSPFLIVKLDSVKFTAGSGSPLKLDVKVKEVKFGHALKFVDDLAKFLAADTGFYIQPTFQPSGLEIGYRFNKDILQLAAVTLQNVSLSIAVLLPFDNKPARFKIAVGTRQKPVLASVGIYGGGFFVGMTLRTDAMEQLEAAMEYGLVTGVTFGGIIEGTAKVTAGVYISLGARDVIAGYFSASGVFTVASIMHAGASLLVTLEKSGANMTGEAVYVFEFSIVFTDYRYEVHCTYLKEGSTNMSEGADGSKDSSSQQSALAGRSPTAVMGVGRGSDETSQKKTLSIVERAADTGRPIKVTAGLADATVWNSYWQSFSDLEDEATALCPR